MISKLSFWKKTSNRKDKGQIIPCPEWPNWIEITRKQITVRNYCRSMPLTFQDHFNAAHKYDRGNIYSQVDGRTSPNTPIVVKVHCPITPIHFRPILADIVVDIDIPIFRYSFLGLFKTDIAHFLQNRYDILIYGTALLCSVRRMLGVRVEDEWEAATMGSQNLHDFRFHF